MLTQPPLRYDPDGDAAMIILHTSSVFKEYIGGTIGTEEMIGGKDNFRYGGYGSLLYNHSGLFVSIAPVSILMALKVWNNKNMKQTHVYIKLVHHR